MKIVTRIQEIQMLAESLRAQGKRIGVVPTMGSLHAGHRSLIELARQHSDRVITTLFVNPTQFGPGEDFERYPRDIERDQEAAAQAGTDILFSPRTNEMYPAGYATYVEVEKVSSILEGKFRPAHFRGVATIVTKLFNITKPHVAVFGQKDAQQVFLIKKLVADLNIDLQILVAPTVREEDGLALSSRNSYLSSQERSRATALNRSLKSAQSLIAGGERSAEAVRAQMMEILSGAEPTQIDYVAFVQPDTFTEVETLSPPSVLVALAVRFGPTRLIDNMVIFFPEST
jgi:pantoate--beta-alanine ligase